jgi:hypothetical protein
MSHRTGIASRWAALLLLSLCSLLLSGQHDAQHGQMNQQRTVTTPLQVNVTGCLKKSSQTGSYYVADQNGRTWELTSKKVDLAKHMNHVVSVSGHPSTGSTPQEGKSEPGQKPGGNQYFGLDVTELEMVSPSCTR